MTSTHESAEFQRAAAAVERALYPLTEPGTVTLRALGRAAARAAIAAIREPTEEMIFAAHNADAVEPFLAGTWRAMIDQILSEHPQRSDPVVAERDEHG